MQLLREESPEGSFDIDSFHYCPSTRSVYEFAPSKDRPNYCLSNRLQIRYIENILLYNFALDQAEILSD